MQREKGCRATSSRDSPAGQAATSARAMVVPAGSPAAGSSGAGELLRHLLPSPPGRLRHAI